MAKFLKSITSGGWHGDESHLEKSSLSESEDSVEREQRMWDEAMERASPSEWPPIETLEELHHHAYRILSNTGDPHRLERTKRMLERYTGEDWRLWKQRFSSSAAADTYGRSAVWGHTGCFQLLTLTWTPGCSSPVHNHPCERCFLLPLQGCMAERRYYVCEETKEVKEFKYTRLQRRRAYWMDDSIGWHAVSNEGDECAVSLHLYIPDIRKCKIVNPRTNDICWCVCPSETRDSLPAASVRLLEIVATAVRSNQSSGSSRVSFSTFSSTPECGLGSPSLGFAGPMDAGLGGGSPVSPAGVSAKATAAEKQALENRTLSPCSGGRQRLLKLLLQAFQSDAEAELQQALAGGGSRIATNVSLISSLLQPFSYYSSCAAALPPAACAAVVMHDLMFERNAAPLADGAALQQISLVLLLALMLSNGQPQESALPFAEFTAGALPTARATRSSTSCAAPTTPLPRPSTALTNASGGAGGAAAAPAGASGDSSRRAHNRRDSDNREGRVADAEGNQREILRRKVSAAERRTNAIAARRPGAAVGADRRRNLPSRSRSSSGSPRRSSTDNSVLRVQLLEAATRAVDAYASCKSSRLWNGCHEAPQLACVGRMLAAQLLLTECDDSYGTPVASTEEVSSQNIRAPCGHRFPVSPCAPCCCYRFGCCSGCVAASASPVALVLRFIDEAMLFHLASFLGWETRLQNATPPAVSGQLCASSSAKGGAAAAEATHRATAAGQHGRARKGQEQEGAHMAVAEQFLFPLSSSFSANRNTMPTEAGLNQSDTGTIGRSTNYRIHAPSVFYRNSTRCSRDKAALLDVLRARIAEGGGAAAAKDPAVQQAAANMLQSLLEDVSRFSPLREVVCFSLLRLDKYGQTAAGELSRRLTGGEARWGKYETHQDDKTASCQLAAGHTLQRKLRQILGDFQRRQSMASNDCFDVGGRMRSSDKLYSRTSCHEKDPAAKTRMGRRTGSVLSGWMGAVKQRLGVTGTYETQSASLSSSGDCVPPVSGHMRYGPQRTVRPVTHDSSAAPREMEPLTAGGSGPVVETQQEEGLKPEQQQKSAPVLEDAGDAAAPPLTMSVATRGCFHKQGVGYCEGAVTARKAEKDAFAACWLPAKEEHLALFRVLVAALHAFFLRETYHPQDLGSRRRLQEPVDMQYQAEIPVKQQQQLQTERRQDTKERRAIPRSQETQLQRGVVAKGGLEGHRQEVGRIREQAHDDGERRKLECVPHEGNAASNTVEAAGLTEAAQEDLLYVNHFVANHLETTPYTFSVYCSEEDVAQLAALRRAVQLFEGDGCPYTSRKLKIEVVRATVDGLLDVKDLSERLSSWQQNIAKERIALEAARSDTTPGSLSKVNSAAGEIGRGRGGETDKRSSDSADGTPPLEKATIVGWPLLVCCSAGRAGGVRCGFDSFGDVRRLCSQYNVWLHVDASTGAAFLLPQEQPFQEYFNGINEADSILWGFFPPLLSQPLPSGTSAPSRQKASRGCAAPLYPPCGVQAALTELIESVWEDALPIALLSRNPAAFFFSSSFRCPCSCVCSPVQTDRSAEPPGPKIGAGVLCDAVSQAGIKSGRAETQRATRLQKGQGEGVLPDLSTACVTSSQLDSCTSPPSTSCGGYCLGELHATHGFGHDSEDAKASTFSSGGNDTSYSFSRLQECDRLHLADSHTEGEEHDESNGPSVDQNGSGNIARRGTSGRGQHLPCVAGAREVSDLQCKDRGVVLAYWCGARRKVVGLGFSVWCFWKKLGDVGVANRARQVYLHCRRLEVFATNFPLRLKSAEYPKFVKKEHEDVETVENAAESRRSVRGSSHVVSSSSSSSSNEDDSSDDVAGDYDIDKKVIFDYEYARLHEASVLPLVAEAAMLLGLPESVVTESSAALRYASVGGGRVQGCQDERDVGEKMCHACTAGDRRVICPFRMCASSNEEGRTRRWTSPSTIAFRWSLPGCWLSPEAAVAAGKQPTMQYSDEVTRKTLEGRTAMYLKSILDTLKKREEERGARRGLNSEAGERSSYTHSAEDPTAYSPIRAAGHPDHLATHKESEVTSRSEGRRAADYSEESEGSDVIDCSSESSPASDDEAGATSAAEVPSFTLLTENFLVDVGSTRRYESAVPAQGSSSVDQQAAPNGTARSPFLTISLKDPRMTEDEGYSLLCLIDRLGELLWSSSRVCTGSREVPFDTLSPDYAEHLHRDLGVSPLMPRYVP